MKEGEKKDKAINNGILFCSGMIAGEGLVGTWTAAMARPSLFRAIAPVCGGVMQWNTEAVTMPVWMIHGSEDTVVNVFYSDDMAARLTACGKDFIYTRIPGVGHNAWDYTYKAELIDWLLSK